MRLGVCLLERLFTQCAVMLHIRTCWKQRQKHFLPGDVYLEPLFRQAARLQLVVV